MTKYIGNDIKKLIGNHENQNIEFKQSFRWNHFKNQVERSIPKTITRAICGFLASKNGGLVIIGIKDNKEIIGIESDIRSYNEKDLSKGRDSLLTDIGEKIRKNIGIYAIDNCYISFEKVDSREIIIITVSSYNHPVIHLKKELYARVANSTVKLTGREAQEFLSKHYKYNKFRFDVEFTVFNLMRYLKLGRIISFNKREKYYSLTLLSLIFNIFWYVSLYIDYNRSKNLFPLSLFTILVVSVNFNIDLIKYYRGSSKNDSSEYIPNINKNFVLVSNVLMIVIILLCVFSFLNLLSSVENNILFIIVYLMFAIIYIIPYYLMKRMIRNNLKFWEQFREKNFRDRINLLKY